MGFLDHIKQQIQSIIPEDYHEVLGFKQMDQAERDEYLEPEDDYDLSKYEDDDGYDTVTEK